MSHPSPGADHPAADPALRAAVVQYAARRRLIEQADAPVRSALSTLATAADLGNKQITTDWGEATGEHPEPSSLAVACRSASWRLEPRRFRGQRSDPTAAPLGYLTVTLSLDDERAPYLYISQRDPQFVPDDLSDNFLRRLERRTGLPVRHY